MPVGKTLEGCGVKKVLVAEFYNTGACPSDGKHWSRICDSDTKKPIFNSCMENKDLLTALANELHNLDESDVLEIRIKRITEDQWSDACRLGEEMA